MSRRTAACTWRTTRRTTPEHYKHAGEALAATSTAAAPWYVVPANHKWYRNLVVADRLVHALEEMDPRAPTPGGIDWTKLRKEVTDN